MSRGATLKKPMSDAQGVRALNLFNPKSLVVTLVQTPKASTVAPAACRPLLWQNFGSRAFIPLPSLAELASKDALQSLSGVGGEAKKRQLDVRLGTFAYSFLLAWIDP